MSITSTETHVGKKTKIERYGWVISDEPGELMWINKHLLVIDRTYQRGVSEGKIKALARDWSWVACSALTIGLRQGVYYVIEGQHRVSAAMRRADITELPCVVFETTTAVVEAKGFLQANTQRKAMSGFDRFRAMVVTKDPAALLVQQLCDRVGREIKATSAANAVRCASSMLKHASNDPEILERLWPLLNELMVGQPLNERLLDALIYIEKRMPDGESLVDRRWRERLLRVGAPALLDKAIQAAVFYKRGGARVWALGVVQALNHRHQIRLKLEGTEPE